MRKRSTRKAALRAKQRTQAISDYENLPDRKVLQGALPPKREVIQKRTFNAAKDRLKPERRMELALQRPRRVNPIQTISVGPMTRHVLFLNVGNERILEAVQALVRGNATPPWTRHLRGLSTKNGKLLLTENGKTLPFAFSEEKRQAVKTLYFDPKEPSTIQPITDTCAKNSATSLAKMFGRFYDLWKRTNCNSRGANTPKFNTIPCTHNPELLPWTRFSQVQTADGLKGQAEYSFAWTSGAVLVERMRWKRKRDLTSGKL